MNNTTTLFEKILAGREWKPIRNCPGRFTLRGGISKITVDEIASEPLQTYRCRSEKVTDEIVVAEFKDGGGLLSYVKGDGLFLHTLNDQNGFDRKLRQLGIELPRNNEACSFLSDRSIFNKVFE